MLRGPGMYPKEREKALLERVRNVPRAPEQTFKIDRCVKGMRDRTSKR